MLKCTVPFTFEQTNAMVMTMFGQQQISHILFMVNIVFILVIYLSWCVYKGSDNLHISSVLLWFKAIVDETERGCTFI